MIYALLSRTAKSLWLLELWPCVYVDECMKSYCHFFLKWNIIELAPKSKSIARKFLCISFFLETDPINFSWFEERRTSLRLCVITERHSIPSKACCIFDCFCCLAPDVVSQGFPLSLSYFISWYRHRSSEVAAEPWALGLQCDRL